LNRYNSYHTIIKELARQDKLPHKFSSFIDRSTIWRWKKESDQKYIGRELCGVDQLEQFLQRPESETVIRAYLKVAYALSRILNQTSQIQKILRENKEEFIRTILRRQKHIQLSFILRLCGISTSLFYYWRNQVLNKCTSSPLKLCRRIYPHQLSTTEVNRMKELLTSPRFRYWPVNSIAYYAMRNNLLAVSLSTWYNYAGKLGLNGRRIPLKKKYQTGIRAKQPHQVWHADITIVRCLNGMKYYVYLLMDNYSRFILNYQVSDRVSAMIRLDSIRQAYDQYIRNPDEDVKLLVDGGIENNNRAVDDYTRQEEISLQKLIAGKDIQFSNSMVEAQNKILKYRYLFKHEFNDIHQLIKLLDWIIEDYQYVRPHHSLRGLTPYEAISGYQVPKDKWTQDLQNAKQLRIRENTKESCGICKIRE